MNKITLYWTSLLLFSAVVVARRPEQLDGWLLTFDNATLLFSPKLIIKVFQKLNNVMELENQHNTDFF